MVELGPNDFRTSLDQAGFLKVFKSFSAEVQDEMMKMHPSIAHIVNGGVEGAEAWSLLGDALNVVVAKAKEVAMTMSDAVKAIDESLEIQDILDKLSSGDDITREDISGLIE